VIPEFQNFLKNPPFTLFNLTPNPQTGEVTFQANLKAYNQIYIVALDLNSVAQRIIDLSYLEATAKRDLSLAASLPISATSGFTESRTTTTLTTDESLTIEDITSTDIQFIDDLKKVRGVLDELFRTVSHSYHGSSIFKDLAPILLKWPSIGEIEEKCKTYYKNLCHELNVFLYMKDRSFFEAVVRPLIQSKLEKTFVDMYLIGQYKGLVEKYWGLERLSQINGFEKCLLVDALLKVGKKEAAKQLVEHLRIIKDSTNYSTIDQDNRVFDIVLNLNMLKGGRGDGGIGATVTLTSTTSAAGALSSSILNNAY
jgi:hypothetical protein